MCSTIDNIDHAIQKRCRVCDEQDIRDILERHELRTKKVKQHRREAEQAAIDRCGRYFGMPPSPDHFASYQGWEEQPTHGGGRFGESYNMQPLQRLGDRCTGRGSTWMPSYNEMAWSRQRELETIRAASKSNDWKTRIRPGTSSSQDIATQDSTTTKVGYHIDSPASTSSSTNDQAQTTMPPRRPLPPSHPSRLPIQADQRRPPDTDSDGDDNITYTPSSSSESSW